MALVLFCSGKKKKARSWSGRAGKYSFEDIHRALFGNKKPKPITVEQMDEAIAKYMREKHGRR